MSINYSRNTKSLIEVRIGGDGLTYEPFFGLNEKPFSLDGDPRFLYDSPTSLATRESLLASIRRREGLIVLTGEIGTGKTTLCRAVLRDLGRRTYGSLVPDPFATREDLLKMLLIDFGVLSIQELTTGSLRQASRTELGYLLSEFLDSVGPDAFVVVIIDEAQNLSLPLIEETRILSDRFGAKGRLQIVFVGQPELHAKLKLPEMRQVDQRVCAYHRLAPMSREAVAGYIEHRLQVAGARPGRVLFPPEIVDGLHRRTGGLPRLINRVCDRALHLAHTRQAEGVDREVLDTALIEIGSATLSPTWDSIVFAEPSTPTPLPVVVPPPTPVAAPPARTVETVQPLDDDEDFKTQIDHWVAMDLALPSRTPTIGLFPSETPSPTAPARRPPPSPAPRPASKPAASKPDAKPASKREAPARTVRTDWPRDLRSETYMQRLWRIWSRRAAIAIAVIVVLNAAIIAASLLLGTLASPLLPALPEAPALAVAGIALPEAPPSDALPASVVSESVADAGEYLVAVGLFAGRDHADRVVYTLTQAGLPAMERSLQLGRQHMQQIVLGPFLSRSDAVAHLQRLQGLGGYEDARVITP